MKTNFTQPYLRRMSLWTLATLVSPSVSSVAFAGNESSGGGNTVRSTREQVLKAIKDHPNNYRMDEFNRHLTIEEVVAIAQRPLLRKVLDRIYGSPFAFLPKIVEDGPCYHDGKPSSASTEVVGSFFETCLSVPELMKIGPSELDLQLRALAVHERVHQVGGTEADAVAIQDFFYRRSQIEPIMGAQGLAFAAYLSARAGSQDVEDPADKSRQGYSSLSAVLNLGQVMGMLAKLPPGTLKEGEATWYDLPVDGSSVSFLPDDRLDVLKKSMAACRVTGFYEHQLERQLTSLMFAISGSNASPCAGDKTNAYFAIAGIAAAIESTLAAEMIATIEGLP